MTDTKLDWRHGNGLPGGGPWRILADCPSRLHNTYNSARNGARRPNPCVCPHALSELAAKREQERAKRDYSREAQLLRKRRKQQAPTYLKSSPAPRTWFPEARCQTPGGRRILDALAEHEEGAGEAARRMCASCPAFERCRETVLGQERPGGGWGGFYAGLTKTERYRMWRQEHGKSGSTDTMDASAGR